MVSGEVFGGGFIMSLRCGWGEVFGGYIVTLKSFGVKVFVLFFL